MGNWPVGFLPVDAKGRINLGDRARGVSGFLVEVAADRSLRLVPQVEMPASMLSMKREPLNAAVRRRPVEEVALEDIDVQIDWRRALMAEMVGTLYPSILSAEIIALQDRKVALQRARVDTVSSPASSDPAVHQPPLKGNPAMETKVKEHLSHLGKRVKDRVTGFEGVLVSVSFDLYGCVQAIVDPGLDKEGKVRDRGWFDIARLKIEYETPVMPQPNFDYGP